MVKKARSQCFLLGAVGMAVLARLVLAKGAPNSHICGVEREARSKRQQWDEEAVGGACCCTAMLFS